MTVWKIFFVVIIVEKFQLRRKDTLSFLVGANCHFNFPLYRTLAKESPLENIGPPHFGFNYLLRSNGYSNMRPYVAVLEKKLKCLVYESNNQGKIDKWPAKQLQN